MTGSELLILIIPAALAVLLLAVLSLEHLLLLTLFLAPLSLQLSYITGSTGIDLSVPTEPILALVLLITLFRLIVTGGFPRELLVIFRNILLPGSLRSIIPGLRLAIGYSWGALVGAEMLASGTWGIGHMIYAARTFYAIDVMFVGLVVIATGGFIMDKIIISYIERKTVVVWGMVSER